MTTESTAISTSWLVPDWPAPANVRALSTTRQGGVSRGAYGLADGSTGGLNLGTHVGDDPSAVAANRARLARSLPAMPLWLEQVHGCGVATAEHGDAGSEIQQADASISGRPGDVCAIMTADCLPVLLCDTAGAVVGAAHAGWRGLCDGVIEATLSRMAQRAGGMPQWLAWLGPAIGPDAFEVGAEVRAAFLDRAFQHEQAEVDAAFVAVGQGKYMADLYALARIRLARAGCTQVFGGDTCTVTDADRFYSYRRDRTTGRMATMVWLGA
ncbi:peptidoglycan editing factor PgeF [Cupriavidus sp. SW-Y-13]|uniref:peptidoglycan editing factor PgeF n=1 Tax=Cupriavidus sp. SW-Y-13 TaxID=2653854 RepID=UPI0013667B32|nr:peptidoglycan editing factor PgeF [Cupriavidus sp. SW-Y-13]MWL87087.1 peptidoglycan editing factor PgeF [Cupriavidus sp. SW-Y-13]